MQFLADHGPAALHDPSVPDAYEYMAVPVRFKVFSLAERYVLVSITLTVAL